MANEAERAQNENLALFIRARIVVYRIVCQLRASAQVSWNAPQERVRAPFLAEEPLYCVPASGFSGLGDMSARPCGCQRADFTRAA